MLNSHIDTQYIELKKKAQKMDNELIRLDAYTHNITSEVRATQTTIRNTTEVIRLLSDKVVLKNADILKKINGIFGYYLRQFILLTKSFSGIENNITALVDENKVIQSSHEVQITRIVDALKNGLPDFPKSKLTMRRSNNLF